MRGRIASFGTSVERSRKPVSKAAVSKKTSGRQKNILYFFINTHTQTHGKEADLAGQPLP